MTLLEPLPFDLSEFPVSGHIVINGIVQTEHRIHNLLLRALLEDRKRLAKAVEAAKILIEIHKEASVGDDPTEISGMMDLYLYRSDLGPLYDKAIALLSEVIK